MPPMLPLVAVKFELVIPLSSTFTLPAQLVVVTASAPIDVAVTFTPRIASLSVPLNATVIPPKVPCLAVPPVRIKVPFAVVSSVNAASAPSTPMLPASCGRRVGHPSRGKTSGWRRRDFSESSSQRTAANPPARFCHRQPRGRAPSAKTGTAAPHPEARRGGTELHPNRG